MVPKGWLLCSAEDICESISVGIVIQPSKYYVSSSEGIRAFRSANVREGVINDSNWVYLSKEGHELNRKSQLIEGDVLIVRTGYPGTACVVTKDYEGSNAIDIVIARPDINKVMSEYLCFYTNSEIGKAQVLNLQGGMAQKHLNVGAYKELKVKLPPLPEQRKIAQILSTWDKAIATTERLFVNKQQQKKALMKRLLTGKQRFAGFEGEWRMCHLRDIVTLEYGKSPKDIIDIDGEYPIVGTGGISGLTNQPLVTQSSVVVGRKGTIDKPALLQVPFWPIDTVFYCLAKPNIDITWFYYWVSSLQLKKYNESSGLPSLSRETLYSIKVSVPPFDEQQTIASVLAKADSELSIIQKQLDNLKLQKKALMQQLLTGKRRVKADEAAA